MTSPSYDADVSLTDSGGVHTNSGVGNKTAYLIMHGGTFNGVTRDRHRRRRPQPHQDRQALPRRHREACFRQRLRRPRPAADAELLGLRHCGQGRLHQRRLHERRARGAGDRAGHAAHRRQRVDADRRPRSAARAASSSTCCSTTRPPPTRPPSSRPAACGPERPALSTAFRPIGTPRPGSRRGSASTRTRRSVTRRAARSRSRPGHRAQAGNTYMRFNHWYAFDYDPSGSPRVYYDGGLVKVDNTGDSAGAQQTSGLPWVNGPTRAVRGAARPRRPGSEASATASRRAGSTCRRTPGRRSSRSSRSSVTTRS